MATLGRLLLWNDSGREKYIDDIEKKEGNNEGGSVYRERKKKERVKMSQKRKQKRG